MELPTNELEYNKIEKEILERFPNIALLLQQEFIEINNPQNRSF